MAGDLPSFRIWGENRGGRVELLGYNDRNDLGWINWNKRQPHTALRCDDRDRFTERPPGRSWMPSRAKGCVRLISMITFSAKMPNVAELPIEVGGIIPPSGVRATASSTAILTGPSCRLRSSSTVSLRRWSMNITSPELIGLRNTGSDWKGRRRARTPECVKILSRSLPSDAPVINVILNYS